MSEGKRGFEATVESLDNKLVDSKGLLGVFGSFKQKMAMKSFVTAVEEELKKQSVHPNNWLKRGVPPVCKIRIEKIGVLTDLKTYIQTHFKEKAHEQFKHFLFSREWNCYFIPVDFKTPIALRAVKKGDVIPVGSSVALMNELKQLDKMVGHDPEKNSGKGTFINVSETEIMKYETTSSYDPKFWLKFAYTLLTKLASTSVEHHLPIIFH